MLSLKIEATRFLRNVVLIWLWLSRVCFQELNFQPCQMKTFFQLPFPVNFVSESIRAVAFSHQDYARYLQQYTPRPAASHSMIQTDTFILSLCQFVHLGEDDDGQISSWRDSGEGGGLRGRGQDGRRLFLLLLIQVGSCSAHCSPFWTALQCTLYKYITYCLEVLMQWLQINIFISTLDTLYHLGFSSFRRKL